MSLSILSFDGSSGALLVRPTRTPGFDPYHIASKSVRASAVASGANFYSLLNGQKGSPSGVTAKVDATLGPAVGYATDQSTAVVTLNTSSLALPAACTMGCIFKFVNGGQFDVLFTPLNGSFSTWIFCIRTVLEIYNGSAELSSGITPQSNIPYFAGVSVSSTAINFVLTNLSTGQIQSSTIAGTTVSGTTEGQYAIGNEGSSNSPSGSIAAVMYAASFLSMPQMLQWAQDPWAFWYPRSLDLADMLSAGSGGGGIAVTANMGAGLEFTSSLRSDAMVLLEYLASIRADSVAQFEALSAVREDGMALPELVEGLSSNVSSQLEFLGSTRSDSLGPIEMASALRSDVVTLMESMAGQRSDAITASEIMAALRADLVGPLEAQGTIGVTGNGAVQVETSGSLQSDIIVSSEMLLSSRIDMAVSSEMTAGTVGQAAITEEITGILRSDASSLTETTSAFRQDTSAALEITGSLASQGSVSTENITGVAANQLTRTENQGGVGVIASAAIQLELLGVAFQAAVDWLVRARRRGRR